MLLEVLLMSINYTDYLVHKACLNVALDLFQCRFLFKKRVTSLTTLLIVNSLQGKGNVCNYCGKVYSQVSIS